MLPTNVSATPPTMTIDKRSAIKRQISPYLPEFDLRLLSRTMSDPVFPPEILDYILDFLHKEPETLKQCCLVSKSWVPRTRQYLFSDIGFYSARTLKSWNNTFPDPTNSPAHHVSTLVIDCYPKDVEG